MKLVSIKNAFKKLFTVEDEYEYEYVDEKNYPQNTAPVNGNDDENVVSLTSMSHPVSKVVLCEPSSYNEVQEIADHVVNRRSVVINLERVDHEQAKRIVDFLSGTVYAVNGDIQKLGAQTFLCTPDNVEISGSITGKYSDADEFEREW